MSGAAPARQPRTKPVVSVEAARVDLGGRPILSRVSFAIDDGELVAILGPNGAGKSTLLSPGSREACLRNRLRPRTAAGRVNGRIGYVPQFRALEAETTLRARDVVRFGLDGNRWGPGWPSKRREKLVDAVLDEVDGRGLAEAAMGELSGGERQRLLIAQALLCHPRLLLLDEPLASLGLGREQEVVGLIRRTCRSRGVAVLFVTHDVNPLLADIDRVLYLAGGRGAIGRPEEVITSNTLSMLYGAPVDVVKTGGRIFVVGART